MIKHSGNKFDYINLLLGVVVTLILFLVGYDAYYLTVPVKEDLLRVRKDIERLEGKIDILHIAVLPWAAFGDELLDE